MSIGRVPGATGIQPSIVTAKGDLIVATASGSVTNQAVGSNNQVLMADSAQADGVKWANEATATLTTTGDLLYASAANTPARLGIGSTDQVLKVSGGVPAWGAAPAGAFKGCYLYLTSDVTLSNNTITELTFGQESFDTDSFHSTSTNTGRITIPAGLGGYYRITARALLVGYTGNSVTPWQVYIYKNGALTGGAFDQVYAVNNNETWVCEINHMMNLSAGDYVTAHVFQKSGANRTVEGVNVHGTAFMAQYLGA